MMIHTVCYNCGHKYEIDEHKNGEAIGVTCPYCKTKAKICNMKSINVLSFPKSEIIWNNKKIFTY